MAKGMKRKARSRSRSLSSSDSMPPPSQYRSYKRPRTTRPAPSVLEVLKLDVLMRDGSAGEEEGSDNDGNIDEVVVEDSGKVLDVEVEGEAADCRRMGLFYLCLNLTCISTYFSPFSNPDNRTSDQVQSFGCHHSCSKARGKPGSSPTDFKRKIIEVTGHSWRGREGKKREEKGEGKSSRTEAGQGQLLLYMSLPF